jgi:hypothetical protein
MLLFAGVERAHHLLDRRDPSGRRAAFLEQFYE